MSLVCEAAAPFVANSAVEETPVIRPFRSHTDACLRCQARHVAMTRTARELKVMSAETYNAPLDLEWRVMASLEGDLAVSRSWRKPVALGAAVLSMAAAIVIWRLRLRPRAQS
jgi:anti-sigma factor RsiW